MASATLKRIGVAPQGSWRDDGRGADGYAMEGETFSLPAYISSITPTAAGVWNFSTSTSDVRALQKPSPATDRRATVRFSSGSLDSTVLYEITADSEADEYDLSVYINDWDGSTRRQTMEVLDADTSDVLVSTEIDDSFNAGRWLEYTVTGSIIVRATQRVSGSSSSAVVNGLFFDPAGTFYKLDVDITSPSHGDNYESGSPVSFTGSATDDDDLPITGTDLVWTSDVDGTLGTGGSLNLSSLSLGRHTITLTATDSLMRSAAENVAITVRGNGFYVTNFGEYSTGSLPSDWIRIGDTDVDVTVESAGIAISGKALHIDGGPSGGSYYGFAAYPDVLSNVVGPVTLRTRFYTTESVAPAPLVAKGVGTPGDSGFKGVYILGGNSGVEIWTLIIDEGTSTGFIYNPVNKWSCAILEVFATDTHNVTRYKIWEGDWEDEPVDWVITLSKPIEDPFPLVGYCGIGGKKRGAAVAQHEYLSVEYVPGAEVTITSPAQGSAHLEGIPIQFTATAIDATDGDLTEELDWEDSIDGALGTGGSFSRDDLSVGVHTALASVENSEGAIGAATVHYGVGVAPPLNLTVFPLGPTRSYLEWTPGEDADSHIVLRGFANGFDPDEATLVTDALGPSASAYEDTTLAPQTTYWYLVGAVYGDAVLFSNYASVTTPAVGANPLSGVGWVPVPSVIQRRPLGPPLP